MRKLALVMVFLIVILGASDCLNQASNLNEEGRRAWPGQELKPYYDISLPPRIKEDLTKAIWYALKTDAAQSLDPSDFDHCHVLLDRNIYEEKYGMYTYSGTPSEWLEGVAADYSSLLCHTQELTGNRFDQGKRNILIRRGKEPYIVPAPYRSIANGTYTLYPSDMRDMDEDVTGAITLTFGVVEGGEIILPDGRQLNVIVEDPDIYTNYTKQEDMVVDLK